MLPYNVANILPFNVQGALQTMVNKFQEGDTTGIQHLNRRFPNKKEMRKEF